MATIMCFQPFFHRLNVFKPKGHVKNDLGTHLRSVCYYLGQKRLGVTVNLTNHSTSSLTKDRNAILWEIDVAHHRCIIDHPSRICVKRDRAQSNSGRRMSKWKWNNERHHSWCVSLLMCYYIFLSCVASYMLHPDVLHRILQARTYLYKQ